MLNPILLKKRTSVQFLRGVGKILFKMLLFIHIVGIEILFLSKKGESRMDQQLEFLYVFTPKRENFITTMTLEEQIAFMQHLSYTAALSAEGKLIFSGACTDGSYGTIVFNAPSLEAAEEIFNNDPAVKAQIVNATLHPFRVGSIRSK
jgi:uncharacterized protein YciI